MTITGSFKVPIYECEIKIIISDNLLRSINSRLKKFGDKGLKTEPSAFFYHPGGDCIVYYLFFSFEKLNVNCINHEKSHVVEKILMDCDIKPIDEVRSYLDGFISHKIDLFFKRRKIKLK